jgi:hypothetical protein
MGSATAPGVLATRDVVSFMNVQERSGEVSLTFIDLFDIYVVEGSQQSGSLHRYGRTTA